MSLVVLLIALATAINGLLSGLRWVGRSCAFPARRGIGALAYATFARGNDVGTRPFISLLLGRGAALLTVLATTFAFVLHARMEVVLLLSFASRLAPAAHLRYHQGSANRMEPQSGTHLMTKPT